MIFLLEYDRERGKLVEIRTFNAADRRYAQTERLKRELALNMSGVCREVVLLEAENQKALQRTHQRYFKTAAELAEYDVTDLPADG